MRDTTITMPFDEFESIRRNEKYWQSKFNTLYRVIRKYVERDAEGCWTVGDHDIVSLADEIEEYMNDHECDSD